MKQEIIEELDALMQKIAETFSKVYDVENLADALIDHRMTIQGMRFGEDAYDSEKHAAAEKMIEYAEQEIAAARKATMAKKAYAAESVDYYNDPAQAFCDANFSPETKDIFMRILGGWSGVEECSASIQE